MEIKTNENFVSFCKISTLTVYEFGKIALVEPENFSLAAHVCRTIANLYIANNRPKVIKDIGATFFGHESFGTLVITFHIRVDLGIGMSEKIEKITANLEIDSGTITMKRRGSEDRFSYQTNKTVDEIVRAIIGHIEMERGEVSLSFFKELGQRLENEATLKLILADGQDIAADTFQDVATNALTT